MRTADAWKVGLALILVSGLALGAACGKTCPKTWSRIQKCAGEGAEPDDDAEAAFRKQCKKLDKKKLKRCLAREDCADFERCVGRASAGKRDLNPDALCQRVLTRGLDCERRKGRGKDEELSKPGIREMFMDLCRKADQTRLRRCLDEEEDCKSFEKCAEGAFRHRDVSRRKSADPVPVPPPPATIP